MSDPDLPRDAIFDADEDNNPFPSGGLASLIQDGQIEGNGSTNGLLAANKPSVGVSSGSAESGQNSAADDTSEDDANSLLLYQNGETRIVNNDHESRVSRLLSPERQVRILINEAGKSNEGLSNTSKKYIVYTIKLTDLLSDEIQTRRRYSDFESLRDILTRIFPLVVIPPIPPKNYFSLGMLNGIVGSAPGAGGMSVSNGLSSVSGADSPPNNGPSYSYINSNYLNKSRLIEHRKRLLANFLNNCLLIPQIRRLPFFAKFLDPSSNWSDEVNLISSQLPKSVYLLNPENGLNTDPIYANLPLPASNHAISLPFLNSLTSRLFSLRKAPHATSLNAPSELSTQVSSNLAETSDLPVTQVSENSESSSRASIQSSVVSKSHLDEINKRIVGNYIGITNDYIELGAFLNSFSMIWADTAEVGYTKGSQENEVKVDLVFDRIGLAYDNSLNTINTLISELETKFSEPLGEAVKYTSVFESTRRFKAKKEKQSKLIDWELLEKKKELADGLRAEMEVSKIEKGIQTQSLNKSAPYSLSASQHPMALEKLASKSRFLPGMGSMKKITKYVSDIMDQNPELTRKQRITQLQERIGILEKCQLIMQQDISYIADELIKNAETFRKNELKSMFQILLNYNQIFISWAKKNVELWEEVKEEIC
ncbi:PX domain-containing protein [Metschnikowia aff. pulcherrima]|uniref:PX domain-containing protein n=1 Tax=Metschnikowia aff. pulcherrima TaxID=2163413 RepID=A0A4V1AED0_9ASCO|nr:PX domain-containing protein [Metschnikowia aff. pulcherrima]